MDKMDEFLWTLLPSNLIRKLKKNISYNGKKIAFGVDSFEDYKIWYEENFIELANKFYDKKIFDYIYLVCGKDKQYIAKDIIAKSNKNFFIDEHELMNMNSCIQKF